MNFFKIKTAWTNAEFIPLKLCIATAYLLVGSYFYSSGILRSILIVFGIMVIWSVYSGLKK